MNIQTQFYTAVNNSNLYDAEKLIDHIDVSENANIYLLTAVRRTDHQMLKLLTEHGADPTARQGAALTTAAENYDTPCLEFLIPYFTTPNWAKVVDNAFEKTVKHHHTFQNASAVKVLAPYANQKVCNEMMAHAILVHKTAIIRVLQDQVDPQSVLNILTSPPLNARLTNYHTSTIEQLEQQVAQRQKQRIEEHLPTSSSSSLRKL